MEYFPGFPLANPVPHKNRAKGKYFQVGQTCYNSLTYPERIVIISRKKEAVQLGGAEYRSYNILIFGSPFWFHIKGGNM